MNKLAELLGKRRVGKVNRGFQRLNIHAGAAPCGFKRRTAPAALALYTTSGPTAQPVCSPLQKLI